MTSLVYTIIDQLAQVEDSYIKAQGDIDSTFNIIANWIHGHYGYSNILMGAFIALWMLAFFRKYQFNFFEILVVLCFVMGTGMLIFGIFTIAQAFITSNIMGGAGIAGIVYSSWAIGQFFDKTKIANYLKAFGAYVLGSVSFWAVAFLTGYLIDLISK